jgi:DNA-directed RNA polymerase specialized sigma24 family protein
VGVTVDQGSAGFRGFVVARSPSLARTAYLLTGDRQLAEDLVQEAPTRVASRRLLRASESAAIGGQPGLERR